MPQEIQFVRIEGETSQELGKRFEEFCVMLLRELEVGDLGRDIIVEIFGMKIVVQCKAWYSKDIGRDKVDEFRTVVRDGKYAFGVLVGALEENFAIGAHKSAKKSEGGDEVIITVYNRMCQDIEWFSEIEKKVLVTAERRILKREYQLGYRNPMYLPVQLEKSKTDKRCKPWIVLKDQDSTAPVIGCVLDANSEDTYFEHWLTEPGHNTGLLHRCTGCSINIANEAN
ncbi:336_t:CDS:2 [Dentiscutata heterogama]|uniref:336_t:CDS:1 n=1 Tax=Dentiscutata heterogama TaxID=1316150 RepID=A0ACA9MSU8_9GLOM|nr:336_t:CDS:2 [Dentiscutata heterogama]